MFKRMIIFIFLFLIVVNLFSEKWVGKAATYQKKTGTMTSNGDLFNSEGFYGACNGFRLGAEVTVINTVTKQKVKVIINDRISEEAEYFILLTPRAAKEIGIEWQTFIVIIEADFSDVNTIDKLEINGLISEGEFDIESLKKFPDINLKQDDNKTENNKDKTKDNPEMEKDQIIPKKEEKKVIMDHDENDKLQEKADNVFPNEEKLKDPDKVVFNKNYDKDEKNVKIESEKPDEEKLKDPDKIAFNKNLDKDEKDNKIETDKPDEEKLKDPDKIAFNKNLDKDEKNNKIEIDKPDEEKYKNPEKDKNKINMDNDYNINNKIPEKDNVNKDEFVINWNTSLISGKYYIRFSTTFDKSEAERRYRLFDKIYKKKILGIYENSKYVLYLGPLNKEDLDKYLELIKSYGYIDAYILKGK